MGERGFIKALRREDEGAGRRGQMESAADCVLAEPAGTGGEVERRG